MKALRAPALAAVALAILAAAPARGAPPSGGAKQAPDQTAQAKAHYKKGSELYRQARYREAIAEFQAAYRLRPHGVLHYNIAQCQEKLGDIPAALASYHDYLREVPGAEDRETVERAVANLESRLAATGVQQMLIYSQPPGAEVLVDGQSRGRTPFSIVLPHGTHVVSLVKAGYETVTRDVALAPERSLQLDFALVKGASEPPPPVAVPLPPPPVPKAAAADPAPATPAPAAATAPTPAPKPVEKGGKLWTWVAGGVAVAAAGAGVYYGVQAQEASDKLMSGSGDPQQNYDDAKSKSKTANILYGVAAAAGAAGVTLFFLEGSF
ncbi:MAG TPA: PEGA domain-containing protein [Anaeromyxobacteraceae bacterium]|nr:PEGA domain-containing protein [Anaeromyxobacteraceae bacterium]